MSFAHAVFLPFCIFALGTVHSLVQPRYRAFSGAETQMRASGRVLRPRMPCENRTISI